MDTLTHALSGALLARATARRAPRPCDLTPRQRMVAGFVAAAAPDIDFVLGYVSPTVYLETHRGITHSVLLLPLWALALAWLIARVARDPRGFRPWLGMCALGIAAHIVGDLITSFGTMIFAPVSSARFALGTTFIIDLWFTGIIAAGLLASWPWRRSRLPATLALAALCAYVGLQALAKHDAERFGERYARERALLNAGVAVHPRPVSPFNWTVFVTHGDDIVFSHVNVVRAAPKASPTDETGFIARLDSYYRPLADARWEGRTRFGATPHEQELARSAWEADALAVFRWFADIPAFDGATTGSTCVWFRDLRFETPGRDAVPFRFGACRTSDADPWLLHIRGANDAVQRLPDRR
jgi:inner membrane protein